ncbi:MAG: hypothetical protein ACRDK2_12470 [Solirubrobacteraceae bacterium]
MRRINLSVVVLASVAVLLAGCGGGSSSNGGVAHLGTSTGSSSADVSGSSSSSESSASTEQKMVAFARCMRSHGVPKFPEPVEGHFVALSRALGRKGSGDKLKESAPFKAAEKQCRKLLPNGGVPSPQVQKQVEEGALKFSACVRSHGVPNFPTPRVEGGQVHLGIRPGSGLDINSPQFQAALKACQSLHGPEPKGGHRGAAVVP